MWQSKIKLCHSQNTTNIVDEIKWQKVNAYHYDKYVRLVDELFEMGKEGLLKIRIFFRHNQYEPELTAEKRKVIAVLLWQSKIKLCHSQNTTYI